MLGRWSLNEVQLPKELQHRPAPQQALLLKASMKCSSRRNCNKALLSEEVGVDGPQ